VFVACVLVLRDGGDAPGRCDYCCDPDEAVVSGRDGVAGREVVGEQRAKLVAGAFVERGNETSDDVRG
jgi:hypothetical protein